MCQNRRPSLCDGDDGGEGWKSGGEEIRADIGASTSGEGRVVEDKRGVRAIEERERKGDFRMYAAVSLRRYRGAHVTEHLINHAHIKQRHAHFANSLRLLCLFPRDWKAL